MARKPEADSVEKIVEDNPKPGTEVTDPLPSAADIFRTMSVEDQDEVIRMILADGDWSRLARIIKTSDTPGAIDLFLDRIGYHHFLPMIKEKK